MGGTPGMTKMRSKLTRRGIVKHSKSERSPDSSIGSLRPSASARRWVGTQPQGDVGGLHRLPHHPHQIAAQGVEVGLVPELGGEGLQGLSSAYFLR